MSKCFKACGNSPWTLCPSEPPTYLVTIDEPAYILYEGVKYQSICVKRGTYPIVYPTTGPYDTFTRWNLTSTSATVANLNAASTTITITNAGASLVAVVASSPMVLRINVPAPPSVLELPIQFGSNSPMTIKWGDGTPDMSYRPGSAIRHTYAGVGTYIVQISGQSALGFGSLEGYTGADLITDVLQWGYIGVSSFSGAFYEASNLLSVPATFVPGVTNTSGMFAYAYLFNSDISQWDVSRVTNMSGMFQNASSFNRPLNSWNVSRVTNMAGMFSGAIAFNQPLNSWSTKLGNVTNMAGMFTDAIAFNQPLDSWNVSNVENMSAMFNGASAFNQPLESWRPNKVKDMRGMFFKAAVFNQPLNSWNVSNVINMASMFHSAFAFNQPLNSWNVSKITNMSSMFKFATAFNQPLNSWNVSNVTNMSSMFNSAYAFNRPLNSWSTKLGKVTNMSSMFNSAYVFNQSLDSWIAPRVTDAYTMFCECPVYGKLEWYPKFSGTPIGYPLYGCN